VLAGDGGVEGGVGGEDKGGPFELPCLAGPVGYYCGTCEVRRGRKGGGVPWRNHDDRMTAMGCYSMHIYIEGVSQTQK
jgi:hypothetical protein